MKCAHILVFAIALASFNIKGQDVEMIPKVSSYLETNGTMKQYQNAYHELLNLMEKQFPKSEKNSEGWTYLADNERKALKEIKALLVPIYVKHFTADDIDKMQSFYETKAGVQLITNSGQLSESQKEEVSTFYGSKVGLKIKEKQQVLSTEISGVSEYWSRDLYETALVLLKEE